MIKKLSEMSLKELWKLFPIFLTKHQSCWESWYLQEKVLLEKTIPHIERISHIGSTAISTIWAKPIIDILIEIPKNKEELKQYEKRKAFLKEEQDLKKSLPIMKEKIQIFFIFLVRFISRALFIFPINKRKICFIAFGGRALTCNPKYIYNSIFNKFKNKYEYIWLIKDKRNNVEINDNTKIIKYI